MTGLNRRRFPRLVGLVFFNGVLLVTLLGLTLWAAGALFFMFPFNVAQRCASPYRTLGDNTLSIPERLFSLPTDSAPVVFRILSLQF